MFFRKSKQPPERTLADLVTKVHHSGYVFDEINGDLGESADEIARESKKLIMAYGYVRRAAAAALYLQGYFKKDDYDYVHSIFKSLQINTEHSVEFQEQAFADAITFMQSYHHVITSTFVKALVTIAQDYEVPDDNLDDDELFETVLETLHHNQQRRPIGHSNHDAEEDTAYLKKSITKNGWQGTITIAAMMVIARIPNKEIAHQFVLEELDGASKGNEYSQETARCSGISPNEYIGALKRSRPEVDGPDGPQQLLMELSFQLADDRELMAKFRCDVGRAIQDHFEIGNCLRG